MKIYKSALPLPYFHSPLYYLMSSAPITTFIYGVYYVFICLFYIIFHQHVSSKEKESLVLFCVFLVSRIETAYRGLRLKAAKHDEKYTKLYHNQFTSSDKEEMLKAIRGKDTSNTEENVRMPADF